jgi:uncharacterized membrane protein YphA (DoxX/SURF4 family)
MRYPVLATTGLVALRIVIGLHFLLEGASHLRDPGWSSAGFRKAAVGPLADVLRADLPQTGDWAGTVGAFDERSVEEAAGAWQESVIAQWKKRLSQRARGLESVDENAQQAVEAAAEELKELVSDLASDLAEYRLEGERLASVAGSGAAREVPYLRERVGKKRRELEALASGWMQEAEAIGERMIARLDEPLSPEQRRAALAAVEPSRLWRADRFVSWSLVTIGAGLLLGVCVKFHAMGGVCFLASVALSQPFWLPGTQATYDQWVEMASLLVLATMPIGGWAGLDFFLARWAARCCPLAACRGGRPSGASLA